MFVAVHESASLIGRLGSSAFRVATTAVSMSLAGSCFSTESAHGPLYGAFLAASCPNGSFEHLPSKSGQLFEQRGAGHQVNILHRFCTSERSVFMPRSAANCLWNFCDYRQMYLIVWLFLVGGRGIEPLTPSMSRKCSSAELTARCDGVVTLQSAGFSVVRPGGSSHRV